jgi:hypothetical protein
MTRYTLDEFVHSTAQQNAEAVDARKQNPHSLAVGS